MDYQDWQQNRNENYFWHQAKADLITILLKRLPLQTDRQILEIGCGTGQYLPLLQNYGQTTGLDNNSEALQIAKQYHHQAKLIKADINNYQLLPNHYDLICCFDVLEHLPNAELVMAKIFSSLKPGGYLFFSVPAHPWLYSQHDRALEHYRRYTKKSLQQLLATAPWAKQQLGYWNTTLLAPIALWRLITKLTGGPARSDAQACSPWLNNWLYALLKQENKWIAQGKNLPLGLTIYGWTQKN